MQVKELIVTLEGQQNIVYFKSRQHIILSQIQENQSLQ